VVKGANMVAVSVGDQDVRDIRPCGSGLAQRRIQSQAARIHTCVDQDDTTRMGHQVRTHVKLDRLGTQRARRDAMPHHDSADHAVSYEPHATPAPFRDRYAPRCR